MKVGRKKIYASDAARRMAHYYRSQGDYAKASYYSDAKYGGITLRERQRTATATLKAFAEEQNTPWEFLLEEAVLTYISAKRENRI